MPSIDLIIAIVVSLAPYFGGALILALVVGIFIPWGLDKPARWLYFYIIGIAFLIGGAGDGSEGSLAKQLTWTICYLLCLAILYLSRNDKNRQKVRIPIELWIVLAWILLSVAWSPQPLVSFKRFALILGALLIAAMTTRMTPPGKSSTDFLLVPLIVFMLYGVFHATVFRDKAFDQDGAMRGFAIHKNPWGQFCLLTVTVLLHSMLNRKHGILYFLLMIPTVAMLLLSKSTTSILAFFCTAALLLATTAVLRHRRLGATLLVAASAAGSVAMLVFTVLNGELPFDYLFDSAFKAAEKSTSLTGRTQLWYLMWGEISQHLWAGTGIGGFWLGPEGASGALGRKLDWGPPGQAHSGYIDTLNEIGIVGCALLALLIWRHAINCLKLYRHGNSEAFMFHSAIASAFLIINYAESSLFLGSSLWFIIFVSSVIHAHSLCAVMETTSKKGQRIPGRSAVFSPARLDKAR